MSESSKQSKGTRDIPASWIEALRAIRANGHNVMGRAGGVLPQVYRALERRGLVVQMGVRSDLTLAGMAVLGAPEPAPVSEWSVTMRNHLYHADDPSDEPAYFHRTFPGATAADAHAAAVAYGLDAGDCSPVEDVAEVEGPLSAPSGAEMAL